MSPSAVAATFACDELLGNSSRILHARRMGVQPVKLSGLSKATLYEADHTSFMDLAQKLFASPASRAPFIAITGLMRRSGVVSVLVHEDVQDEPYFSRLSRPVARELKTLNGDPRVTQITFWSSRLSRTRLPARTKGVPHGGLLASCVIVSPRDGKADWDGYIYEAIVGYPTKLRGRERLPMENTYYHVGQPILVRVGPDHSYVLGAAYFCQQNGSTSVCAHSCLKMVLWHSQVGSSQQPPTDKINGFIKRWRPDHDVRKGLFLEDVMKVCEEFGATTMTLDCRDQPDISPHEFAYLLVESGIPTIVVFATKRETKSEMHHMFPVVGHTMNPDLWLPAALDRYPELQKLRLISSKHTFVSSSEFAPEVVVHDDLLGPYMHLSPTSLTRGPTDKADRSACVMWVFGVVPNTLKLPHPPYTAQQVGARYVHSLWGDAASSVAEPWRSRLVEEPLTPTTLVLRTQLIRRDFYLRHLGETKDHYGNSAFTSEAQKKLLQKRLPAQFWMVEFSTTRLFSSNRSKLGEVLLPLGLVEDVPGFLRGNGDAEPPLAFRLLGEMTLYGAGGRHIPLRLKSHTPLFRRRRMENEF